MSTVPLILERTDKNMPLTITTQWLDWVYNPNSDQQPPQYLENEEMLDYLVKQFPTLTGEIKTPLDIFDTTTKPSYGEPGDPRNAFIDNGNETTFLALKDGELGALSKALTMYIQTNLDEEIEENGCLYVTPHQWTQKVNEYTQEMEKLSEKYPHTFFCLAANNGTYMNRLCLMAFTPLKKNSPVEYVSPYNESEPDTTIGLIDDELNELICRV